MRLFAMISTIILTGNSIAMEGLKPEPVKTLPITAQGTLILKNLLSRELTYNYIYKIENRRILSSGNVQPLATVTVDPDPTVKKDIALKPWGVPISFSIVDKHNGTTQTLKQTLVALGLYELDYDTQESSIIIKGPITP